MFFCRFFDFKVTLNIYFFFAWNTNKNFQAEIKQQFRILLACTSCTHSLSLAYLALVFFFSRRKYLMLARQYKTMLEFNRVFEAQRLHCGEERKKKISYKNVNRQRLNVHLVLVETLLLFCSASDNNGNCTVPMNAHLNTIYEPTIAFLIVVANRFICANHNYVSLGVQRKSFCFSAL